MSRSLRDIRETGPRTEREYYRLWDSNTKAANKLVDKRTREFIATLEKELESEFGSAEFASTCKYDLDEAEDFAFAYARAGVVMSVGGMSC